jgi:hypothetical protein
MELFEKLEGKRLLGRYSFTYKNDIKMGYYVTQKIGSVSDG